MSLPSRSCADFENSIRDAEELVRFYEKSGQPPLQEAEVMKRAGLVMAVTAWETYLEDRVCEEVEGLWQPEICGAGRLLREKLKQDLACFNTPNAGNTRKLFEDYVGVDVTKGWRVIGNDSERTKERLTQIIHKRGEVVHRAKGSMRAGQLPRHKVRKEELVKGIAFLRALVQATEEALAKISRTPRGDSPLRIAGNSQAAAVASPLFLAAQSSEAVQQMTSAFWSHMWPIIVFIFFAEGFITFLKLRKSKGNDGRRGRRRR